MAAALLHRVDPDGVMGIFTADHIITPVKRFAEIVTRGFAVADEHPDALVTFGITPTHPHTGLGYVQRGERLRDGVYRVRQFKEKPDETTARQYLESGEYYWNSGMFVWRTETILRELSDHLPASVDGLTTIADAWDGVNRDRVAGEIYPTLEKISIDFAVMEKAQQVNVVEMDCSWIDVGSWPALQDVLEPDASGNVSTLSNQSLLDARDNILVSEGDHLIAAIGVEGLVIVHSDDATLVCRHEDAQRIKELVAQLGTSYL
jgi:mannose-1-phosphate guanylyltransferase